MGNVTAVFAPGKRVPLNISSTVGSLISFPMMLLFLLSLGAILKGGRVGSKWELGPLFFSLT